MSKEIAYKSYEELKTTLHIDFPNSFDTFKKIIKRNYIISTYAIWETYAKKKVYDTYIDYEYLLHNENFIKRYLKKSFGKQYLSSIFLKDISDTRVKKEILCQSNNLKWGEFEEILNVIGFQKQKLEEKINDSEKISNITGILKNLNLLPLQEEIGTKQIDNVSGYLNLIVTLRNEISHNYTMRTDENLSVKQMVLLIDLLKCLIGIIEEFIEEEIKELYLKHEKGRFSIPVHKVIKGCNASGDNNAIVEIDLSKLSFDSSERMNLNDKEWVIKSATNKGYCIIESVNLGEVKLKSIPTDKKCTVSLLSNIKIRNSSTVQYVLEKSVYKETKHLHIISSSV